MLAMLILVAQVGIPMHLHYCKGILESVSVFVTNTCGDHAEAAPVDACCKNIQRDSCHQEDSDCCHDQVRVLQQDIKSLIPYGGKWMDMAVTDMAKCFPDLVRVIGNAPVFTSVQEIDSSPPRYILVLSLVYYG